MNHDFSRFLTAAILAGLSTVGPWRSLAAQEEALPRRMAGIATGPTFFYGAEGNTIGVHLEASLSLRIRRSRTWLRTDLSSHSFGAQRLYPCLLAVQGTCYSTSRRAVFGAGLGVQHEFSRKARAGNSYYGSLGVTALASSRVAERYPECAPGKVCSAEPLTHDIDDLDVGIVLGLGQSWRAGSRVFFVESRLYQPVGQGSDADDPYTRFRFMPLTLGIRF